MRIIEIIKILEKYLTDSEKQYLFWTEHDVLGFNINYELISQEDLKALDKLGVFYSSEYDSLIMFT